MDEHEFDSLRFPPYDGKRFERLRKLARALWGLTVDDLRRQLLTSIPVIPSGFDLSDFQSLQQHAEAIFAAWTEKRYAWAPLTLPTISIGTQRLTFLEARCEVVRRAIEFLERRR